jgi:hypothetical protein
MKIFSDLKSITLPDGSQVKIVAMSDAVESHIRKFHLKRTASFQRSDTRVVEKARSLARKRDNSLLVVRTDDGFDLYDMKEESEIQGRPAPGSSTGYVPTARQDRGCLIAIGVIVAIVVISYIIIVINKQSRMSSQSEPVPQQGQLVGTMRAVNANQLNMRSGAGQTYPIVRVFTRNERIVTIGDSQNVNGEQWIQASTPDGQIRGWVIRKFLSP